MDILEFQNLKNGLFDMNLKGKKSNRTTFTFSGTINLTEDLTNDYEVELKFFYSVLGNNRFVLMPFKCHRREICYYVDNFFNKYVQSGLEKVSDVPKAIENEALCPLYKKVAICLYYVFSSIFKYI